MTDHEVKSFCETIGDLQDLKRPITVQTVRTLLNWGLATPATMEGLGNFADCQRGCLAIVAAGAEFIPPTDCKRRNLGMSATNCLATASA